MNLPLKKYEGAKVVNIDCTNIVHKQTKNMILTSSFSNIKHPHKYKKIQFFNNSNNLLQKYHRVYEKFKKIDNFHCKKKIFYFLQNNDNENLRTLFNFPISFNRSLYFICDSIKKCSSYYHFNYLIDKTKQKISNKKIRTVSSKIITKELNTHKILNTTLKFIKLNFNFNHNLSDFKIRFHKLIRFSHKFSYINCNDLNNLQTNLNSFFYINSMTNFNPEVNCINFQMYLRNHFDRLLMLYNKCNELEDFNHLSINNKRYFISVNKMYGPIQNRHFSMTFIAQSLKYLSYVEYNVLSDEIKNHIFKTKCEFDRFKKNIFNFECFTEKEKSFFIKRKKYEICNEKYIKIKQIKTQQSIVMEKKEKKRQSIMSLDWNKYSKMNLKQYNYETKYSNNNCCLILDKYAKMISFPTIKNDTIVTSNNFNYIIDEWKKSNQISKQYNKLKSFSDFTLQNRESFFKFKISNEIKIEQINLEFQKNKKHSNESWENFAKRLVEKKDIVKQDLIWQVFKNSMISNKIKNEFEVRRQYFYSKDIVKVSRIIDRYYKKSNSNNKICEE